MAFGQPTGPPASHRQVQTLLRLLEDAGHADFRDARGPMGFTQRQAGGRFTREEAEAFIAQLEQDEHERPPDTASPANLREISDHDLAGELQRRGWAVIEP